MVIVKRAAERRTREDSLRREAGGSVHGPAFFPRIPQSRPQTGPRRWVPGTPAVKDRQSGMRRQSRAGH